MVRMSRKGGFALAFAGALACLLGSAPAAAQQDTLTLGNIIVDFPTLIGGGVQCTGNVCDVKLPVYIRDATGSPAGVDKAPNRINGYTIEANYGVGAGTSHAAGAGGAGTPNPCITNADGTNIFAGVSPTGNNPGPLGTIGQPSLFTGNAPLAPPIAAFEILNAQSLWSANLNLAANASEVLAFNQSAVLPGDFMGFINFTLNGSACSNGVIPIIPSVNTQTNGPVVQNVGVDLATVAGSITITGLQVGPTPTATPAGVGNTPTVTPTTTPQGPTNTPTQTPTAGAATNTPTRTPTVVAGIPTNTPTRTPTAVPPTATSTATPTPQAGPQQPTPIPTLDTRALAALAVLLAAVGLMLTKRLIK
jgi:hypothetical protein